MSLIRTVSQTILRSEAQTVLTVDLAVRTASAAKQFDVAFDLAVTGALQIVDKIEGHEPFGPELLRIQVTYRTYVWASDTLSLAIADYGESFDNKIIKLCANKSLTVKQRRDAINEFIKEADAIHTTAKGIMTNLNTLKDDFTAVVIRFCAWITKEIENLVKEIKRALEQLERDIERLRRAAAAAIIGSMLPDSASSSDLAVASSDATSDLARKDYVGDAVIAIDALGKLWQAVTNDAQEIELWLKDGADDADIPEYMKCSLEEAVKIYADMAVPLRAYAKTLTDKKIPHPEN
ncbi:hypothetical protein DAEQUDRAFT_730550 [Daedalea quercina L-15889]|uniref:Uncharacterized protein n=1 Tax=Daedalea quercina L-15889 TaxID=1314783 RepID=A0A165MW96_9APHY|nr:hypothetical protein DAEQUDRAFT_730550 [Daedalea quercina L-15889]